MNVVNTRSRVILGGLSGLLAVGLLAGPALAAKGGGHVSGGSGTVTLVVLESTDGLPHFGGRVTYEVSTTATAYPYVRTSCVQNGKQVLSTSAGYFDSYAFPSAQTFALGPTGYWASGAADCTATLYMAGSRRETVLGTTTYHVNA